MEGITTIRAHRKEKKIISEFFNQQILFTSASYITKSSYWAFAFYLDVLSNTFFAFVLAKMVFFDDKTSPGIIGLAINQSSMLVFNLRIAIRDWADIESSLTAVERVLEYADAPQELTASEVEPKWPIEGEILLKNVCLTYLNSSEPTLENVNINIKPKEKVGIIGRTGSGKSTILSALFRIYDYNGDIIIDDVNIKRISIEQLRSSISVIPQDSVILLGTFRNNIDPKRLHSDEEVWQVLNFLNLQHSVKVLDDVIIDRHSQFSAGEKQLFSLAQALLSKNKIVVMDEPTTNLDSENAALIEKIIWETLASSTVLVITHSLKCILKCDRILVLDNGQIVEEGTPNYLSTIKNGHFYQALLSENFQ